ncbi:MAG: hypothetical protein ABR543_13785 [Gemmatimonadaceae bacterium]
MVCTRDGRVRAGPPLVGETDPHPLEAADTYTAYASGTITIPSGQPGAGTYELTGMTDTKVRASARLGGDRILATLGLNIPTGKTSLDSTELRALRVLGAPALRFQTPGLGSGVSGTTGVVVTQMLGNWAWGLGASYEYRGAYSPAESFAAGTGAPDLDPGEAVRVSLGTDGFVGPHQMSMSISSTFYTEDHVSFQTATGPRQYGVRLGPSLVAEWQLRLASERVRELTLYAFDRYRTTYERDGVEVDGTSGNELDFGANGAASLSRRVSLLLGASGRHHTGLKVDETLSTAAILSGGVQLGLSLDVGGGLVIQPLAGVEFATIGTGTNRLPANKLEFAIAIGTR